MSRRGFLATAAVTTVAGAALAEIAEGPISRSAPSGAKTGPLGKVIGELPPGRYDSHIHVMGGEPDPDKLYNSLKTAKLAGACIFSQPPRKTLLG